MSRLRAFLACLALGACTQRLAVQPISITDHDQYAVDVRECWGAARAYQPRFSIVPVVMGAVSHALNVIAYWGIYPNIPYVAAAGGAAEASIAPLDPSGQLRANVFRHCMADKLARDRAGIIANPDN